MTSSQLQQELLSNLDRYPEQIARVFHGRGGAFPGLESINIEWYPPVLFVQCYQDSLPAEVESVLKQLSEELSTIDAILVQTRPWPKVETDIFYAASNTPIELPMEFNSKLSENLSCGISLGKNRNTGVFPDMRSGWEWIQEHAQDKRVLNLFSYTGVFSLLAIDAGAAKVVNIDMCGSAVKTAQRNHQLNEIGDSRASFWKRNILKSNNQIAKQSNFDIIILDPPPFQKGSFNGWGDYQKLLRRCKQYLKESGTILASLNNQQVSLEEFKEGIHETLEGVKTITQLPLSPEIKESDPTKGLKLVLIEIDQ